MDSTHGQQRRASHDITALRQHTRSATSGVDGHHRPWTAQTVDNVGHGITSPPLDNKHARQRRAWHGITSLGLHTRSNNVGRGMQSSPMGSTDNRTATGIACHHRPWTANTIEQRQAWHAIIALGQHTRSDDVGHGMTSPHLENTHGRQCQTWHDYIIALGPHTRSKTSGVA